MVRGSRALHLKDAGAISKALQDILVCPLSKQPLRFCQETQSLISDAIGVSFPVVDGIPCLVPRDGKIIEDEEKMTSANGKISTGVFTDKAIDATLQDAIHLKKTRK